MHILYAVNVVRYIHWEKEREETDASSLLSSGVKVFLSTIVEILNRFLFKSTAFRLTPFGHHKDSEESIVDTRALT